MPNVPVIDLIAEYLSAHGVGTNRVDYAPGKQNLIAAIGPTDAPPLILSGHTDVVPVAGQNWETDPFRLTKRDGAYYGRGSADMKGFLALCLSLVPRWVTGDLARPVLLVFSCDEEIGCRGVMPAIDSLVSDYPAPLGAIIGEPTSLQVITREKGNVTLETEITGVAAHSANPQDGSNAIIAAAHFIRGLSDLSDELAMRTDPGFDPDHTTLNVGMIYGGIQKNIVPDRCVIRWEIRPVPGPDRDEVIVRADALPAPNGV